jgi:hypothetical protein
MYVFPGDESKLRNKNVGVGHFTRVGSLSKLDRFRGELVAEFCLGYSYSIVTVLYCQQQGDLSQSCQAHMTGSHAKRVFFYSY